MANLLLITELQSSFPGQTFPHPNPGSSLTLSSARPALQAENPGHVWGPQHPRAAGDPGRLAGDAAFGTGHRRRLRWQVGRARLRGAGDSTHQAGATMTPEIGDAPRTPCYITQAEPRGSLTGRTSSPQKPSPFWLSGWSSCSHWWPRAAGRPPARPCASSVPCPSPCCWPPSGAASPVSLASGGVGRWVWGERRGGLPPLWSQSPPSS